MLDIITKIKHLYDDLSKTDKIIASYILGNIHKAPHKAIHDLAKEMNVSVSSVSRFAKTIGFDNLKDLKIGLATETIPYMQEIYNTIDESDGVENIIKKVFLGNARSIEDTLKALNYNKLIDFSKECTKAERIVFFGIGSSGNIAREASLRFTHLNIQSEAYSESMHMILQAARLKKDQIACGITHSGMSIDTVQAMKHAADNGAVTIGITNYPKSPLRKICKYFFCTSFFVGKMKAVTVIPLIPQLCLLDAIYLLVAYYKKEYWVSVDENFINTEYRRTKIKGAKFKCINKIT
jgi:RpiR family transcriptional regulator, carbohydrate utilization regulator